MIPNYLHVSHLIHFFIGKSLGNILYQNIYLNEFINNIYFFHLRNILFFYIVNI